MLLTRETFPQEWVLVYANPLHRAGKDAPPTRIGGRKRETPPEIESHADTDAETSPTGEM